MIEQSEGAPRALSQQEGAQAACFLFELNTKETDVLEIAERAGLAPGTPLVCPRDGAEAAVVEKAVLLREWYAFVHAAVVYGLMAEAPNAVVADYLRATRELLATLAGYDTARIDDFIDDAFAGYIQLMARNQQKECPARFYRRVLGAEDITLLPPERVGFLSGIMAITMCAVLDKLGQYTFSVD